MPLPQRLARFNDVATNRVVSPLSTRLPGFALIEHAGRRTGTVRHTPVNLYVSGDRAIVALAYGRGTQWARNVLAANGCTARTRRGTLRLTDPEVVHDPARTLAPRPVRPALAAIRVSSFLVLRIARD